MRLELAERLRCPRPHAPTPLIVVARRTVERELLDGLAGCPVCRLEARIKDGDVHFPSDVPHRPEDTVVEGASTGSGSERLDRLVAQLGLAEPGASVLLSGRYAAFASALASALDAVVVTLNSRPDAGAEGVASVWCGADAVPFTDATFRAVALDAGLSVPMVLDAIRTVGVGGHVLGALPLERPAAVRELARDATEWIGERDQGPAPVVQLLRADIKRID